VTPIERLYLDDVVSGTVARLTRFFEVRGVSLRWGRLDETAVLANPHIVDQVTQILLENAAQYGGRGSTVYVSVAGEESGRGVLIVEDDGAGIGDVDPEALFTPFVRGPVALETGERGSGLGLAVARWLVERCGGTIAAERRAPSGARFVVRLPAP
jgi:signal transduction histidine kinase